MHGTGQLETTQNSGVSPFTTWKSEKNESWMRLAAFYGPTARAHQVGILTAQQ